MKNVKEYLSLEARTAFANQVREQLESLGVTHATLALACCDALVTEPYVKAILSGKVNYTSRKMRAIAAALGLNDPR
jgi:predicted transcriptional regulator